MACLICGGDRQEPPAFRTFLSPSAAPGFCPSCRASLSPIDPRHSCPLCGRDLTLTEDKFIRDGICTDCIRWKARGHDGTYQGNVALFTYTGPMKELVTRFKFRGDAVLAEGFRAAFQKAYRKMCCGDAQNHWRRLIFGSGRKQWLIVPIPLSPARLNERGFNQAEILAGLTGQPVVPVLVRTGGEQRQSKRSRRERIMQTERPFALNPDCGTGPGGKNILLIDDIYTTGATLRHAAAVLEAAGPQRIRSLTLAHG
ncbi:ComF family protein [Sporolactobacillus vineae]|uniref:ComF family protein n=1 Tax=Sporolactobacillus vineae TaxID=444463 RepID=UPI0002886C26|nr:ComF family protein [Sporolactobacillus vineae]